MPILLNCAELYDNLIPAKNVTMSHSVTECNNQTSKKGQLRSNLNIHPYTICNNIVANVQYWAMCVIDKNSEYLNSNVLLWIIYH